MKTKISVLIIMTVILSCFSVVYAENNIQCTTTVTDSYVHIEGQLIGVSKAHNVTLLVGDINNIVYINQTLSEETGKFTFDFRIADSVPSGEYTLKIGSDSECTPYNGILKYIKPGNTEEVKCVEAAVNVTIKNYVPQIEGTVSCTEGKVIVLNIENVTDNTVLANEVITSDKAYLMSYTLPSLLKAKNYAISVTCMKDTETLASMDIDISSSTILISLTGEAHTADNVNFMAELKSNNTGLIDKSTTFSGYKSISTTLPNIVSNMSYNLSAVGYETVIKSDPEPPENIIAETYDVIGQSGEEFILSGSANNITSFEGKTFKLKYNSDQIEAIDISAQDFNNILSTGQIGNIEIISYQPGCIEFRLNEISVGAGRMWSGVLNLFKFRYNDLFNGTTHVTLEMRQ